MPVIDKNGNIGYYAWESKIDYQWMGIPRGLARKPSMYERALEAFTEGEAEYYALIAELLKEEAEA